MIIELLKDMFIDAKIPGTFYETKKTGLNYTKIQACPNHCMLFWGEDNQDLEECKRGKTTKWNDNKKKRPRFQRLFMCSKTAKSIRWHALEGN